MKFLIDANLGRKFTNLINTAGYKATFINDLLRNASDDDILILAERENLIVITGDKDFGKLIFKSGRSSQGVILIRAAASDPEKRFEMVKDALNKAKGKFVIVKEGQIRVRSLE
jgi:predicted nuclease of predicted toxin-antitoxin system